MSLGCGNPVADRVPHRLEHADLERADVVVTMGCGDVCPVSPGKRYEDRQLPDRSGRPLAEVRAVRDEIEHRVRRLAGDLG